MLGGRKSPWAFGMVSIDMRPISTDRNRTRDIIITKKMSLERFLLVAYAVGGTEAHSLLIGMRALAEMWLEPAGRCILHERENPGWRALVGGM